MLQNATVDGVIEIEKMPQLLTNDDGSYRSFPVSCFLQLASSPRLTENLTAETNHSRGQQSGCFRDRALLRGCNTKVYKKYFEGGLIPSRVHIPVSTQDPLSVAMAGMHDEDLRNVKSDPLVQVGQEIKNQVKTDMEAS